MSSALIPPTWTTVAAAFFIIKRIKFQSSCFLLPFSAIKDSRVQHCTSNYNIIMEFIIATWMEGKQRKRTRRRLLIILYKVERIEKKATKRIWGLIINLESVVALGDDGGSFERETESLASAVVNVVKLLSGDNRSVQIGALSNGLRLVGRAGDELSVHVELVERDGDVGIAGARGRGWHDNWSSFNWGLDHSFAGRSSGRDEGFSISQIFIALLDVEGGRDGLFGQMDTIGFESTSTGAVNDFLDDSGLIDVTVLTLNVAFGRSGLHFVGSISSFVTVGV